MEYRLRKKPNNVGMDVNEAFRILEDPFFRYPNFYKSLHNDQKNAIEYLKKEIDRLKRQAGKNVEKIRECKRCKKLKRSFECLKASLHGAARCSKCKHIVGQIVCEKCE